MGEQAGAVLVVDGQGRALAHPDPQQVGVGLTGDPGVAAALARRKGAAIVTGEDNEPLLATFAPVGGSDWVVLVEEPVAGIIGPILRFSSLAPVVAAGAGLLSLLVLAFGYRTIVRPLQRLSQAAGQVSWGDYSAISAPVGGVQEIRDLHRALAEMVERIRGYQAGMRDYLGAVTQGQETERARLARELHDGPVQDLIGLAQRAEMAQRLVERGATEQAQALLEETRQAELETVNKLRRIIGALRPVYLDDLGFLPALEMLVRQMAERTPARIRLEKGGHGASLRSGGGTGRLPHRPGSAARRPPARPGSGHRRPCPLRFAGTDSLRERRWRGVHHSSEARPLDPGRSLWATGDAGAVLSAGRRAPGGYRAGERDAGHGKNPKFERPMSIREHDNLPIPIQDGPAAIIMQRGRPAIAVINQPLLMVSQHQWQVNLAPHPLVRPNVTFAECSLGPGHAALVGRDSGHADAPVNRRAAAQERMHPGAAIVGQRAERRISALLVTGASETAGGAAVQIVKARRTDDRQPAAGQQPQEGQGQPQRGQKRRVIF